MLDFTLHTLRSGAKGHISDSSITVCCLYAGFQRRYGVPGIGNIRFSSRRGQTIGRVPPQVLLAALSSSMSELSRAGRDVKRSSSQVHGTELLGLLGLPKGQGLIAAKALVGKDDVTTAARASDSYSARSKLRELFLLLFLAGGLL